MPCSNSREANDLPASGYFGPLTRAKIATLSGGSTSVANSGTSGLTQMQVQAILSLLQSFGVDQTTIENVQRRGTGINTLEGFTATTRRPFGLSPVDWVLLLLGLTLVGLVNLLV